MTQKGQEKSPKMVLERRKTLTMSWEGLGEDDDDDRFFETFERLSSAVSLDLASSGSDDEYDDGRMSFTSAMSAYTNKSTMSSPAPSEDLSARQGTNVFEDFNMWMSEPGSIKERRRRLFQDMGLSSNKSLISHGSSKPGKAASKIIASENEQQNLKKEEVLQRDVEVLKKDEVPKKVDSHQNSVLKMPTQEASSSTEVVLVRSRSDGDIDTCSANTKMRKEELMGPASKQRLTRTLSTILTPQAGINPYAKTMQVSTNTNRDRAMLNNGATMSRIMSNGVGSFFLIKDLDSGKEFVVKEFNDDGMWNRLSDVQTGKQLTMEEFEKSVGYSPVVKELMRRENVSRLENESKISANSYFSKSFRNSKRKGVALCQEIHAHEGSIWTIKFSPDARYLASAGEDRVVHVWEVQECEVMSPKPGDDFAMSASMPDHPNLGDVSPLPSERGKELPPMSAEKKKKGKASNKKKTNSIPDYVYVPETVFSLSEKPVCSFTGHLDDVLDLSWSKTQLLLSASMDKTVRLWDMETKSCLRLFAHNDYVTCIQFNPIDDNYFISGSLDAKVRIWNIPDRQVVDYTDLHEMVTAARYTPDGQGALIGSHKGGYRLYSTADCCLEQKDQIELHRKNKEAKKVTGFEFAPGNPSEVLVTSADSRIRIVDGSDVTHKFRGFRNTSSQISASFSADGKYVVSASEDSQVYIWKREELKNSGTGKSKGLITTFSHENFQCKDVSVATTWPGSMKHEPPVVDLHSKRHSKRLTQNNASGSPSKDDNNLGTSSRQMLPPLPKKSSAINEDQTQSSTLPKKNTNTDRSSSCHDEEQIQTSCTDCNTEEKNITHVSTLKKKSTILDRSSSCHEDDPSHVCRTDSEIGGIGESFTTASSSIRYGDSPSISASSKHESQSWSSSWSLLEGHQNPGGHTFQATAWGMVIVTAGLGGEIRAYQNLGLPVKVGRQTSLF